MKGFSVMLFLIIGILLICAGIFKWKIPSIVWYLRDTKYGELINSIAMMSLGIVAVIIALKGLK